jgi:hypothetical protein
MAGDRAYCQALPFQCRISVFPAEVAPTAHAFPADVAATANSEPVTLYPVPLTGRAAADAVPATMCRPTVPAKPQVVHAPVAF